MLRWPGYFSRRTRRRVLLTATLVAITAAHLLGGVAVDIGIIMLGMKSGVIYAHFRPPSVSRYHPPQLSIQEPNFVLSAQLPLVTTTWGGVLGWVPLWIPTLVVGLMARSSLNKDRKASRGCCVSCGYDRRGLAADAKCPECGTVSR